MKQKTTIQEELASLNSSLPYNLNEPVFNVPENYFQNFAQSVLYKIREQESAVSTELTELSPVLSGISKKMPYQIPENYFENLTSEIPAIISDEALPAVIDFSKSNPYQVPAGYFDGLSEQVLRKIPKTPGKVISINRSRNFMRMAVAAMVTAVIALSGILYFTNNNSVDPVYQSEEWVAKKLDGVSTQALDDFINSADFTSESGNETASKPASVEVKKMLNDVSTKELDVFLAQVGSEEDLYLIN
jgi:hypothetical protein